MPPRPAPGPAAGAIIMHNALQVTTVAPTTTRPLSRRSSPTESGCNTMGVSGEFWDKKPSWLEYLATSFLAADTSLKSNNHSKGIQFTKQNALYGLYKTVMYRGLRRRLLLHEGMGVLCSAARRLTRFIVLNSRMLVYRLSWVASSDNKTFKYKCTSVCPLRLRASTKLSASGDASDVSRQNHVSISFNNLLANLKLRSTHGRVTRPKIAMDSRIIL